MLAPSQRSECLSPLMALEVACENGDVHEVRNILNNNAIPVNVRFKTSLQLPGGVWESANGMTPLMIAANRGHTALVAFLLQQPGIDISLAFSGMTALQFALKDYIKFTNANYQIAYKLIQAGADINQIRGDGNNLLLIAWVYSNQEAAIKLVILCGANIDISKALFKACHQNHFGYDVVPQQIALTKKYVIALDHAKQLGIDMGRLCSPLSPELDLKIAEFLFEKNSLAMRAFEAGYTTIREQLTPPTPIPQPLAWMRDFANETRWQEWEQQYNGDHPNRAGCGYGPGAMVCRK